MSKPSGTNITLRQGSTDLWSVHWLSVHGALTPVASNLRKAEARKLCKAANRLRRQAGK